MLPLSFLYHDIQHAYELYKYKGSKLTLLDLSISNLNIQMLLKENEEFKKPMYNYLLLFFWGHELGNSFINLENILLSLQERRKYLYNEYKYKILETKIIKSYLKEISIKEIILIKDLIY